MPSKSTTKTSQLNNAMIIIIGLALMYGGYYGVGYWFDNADCETYMNMKVGNETQEIPMTMSENLERLMCVTDNRELFVVSILSPLMLIVGGYTVVKGTLRIFGCNN